MINSDYDCPFESMSEEEFLYRAMDEEDEMYMGDLDDKIDNDCTTEEVDDEEVEDEKVNEELEEIMYTLKAEWDYCDVKTKEDIECDVLNVKILSIDGDVYNTEFDLLPDSYDETKMIHLNCKLKKQKDKSFEVIDTAYISEMKRAFNKSIGKSTPRNKHQ